MLTMRNKENYNNYQKEYQLKRYHQRRKQAFEKLGNKCIVCGTTVNLDIDHVDYRQKTLAINKLWSVAESRFWSEIEKCQLLCIKHHKAKTSLETPERRPITHGKYWAAYKYQCQCDECLQFKIRYNSKRREKRNSERL